MARSGLSEIISLICTIAIWGQYPVFSHPEFPQGLSVHPLVVAAIADDCDILCLLNSTQYSIYQYAQCVCYSIPGLGRSAGGGHGNSLQYSCLENAHGQRSQGAAV